MEDDLTFELCEQRICAKNLYPLFSAFPFNIDVIEHQ